MIESNRKKMSVVDIINGTDIGANTLVFAIQFPSGVPPTNGNQYPILYLGDGASGLSSTGSHYDITYGPNITSFNSPQPNHGSSYGFQCVGYSQGVFRGPGNQLITTSSTTNVFIITVTFAFGIVVNMFAWNGATLDGPHTFSPGDAGSAFTTFSIGSSPTYNTYYPFTLLKAAYYTENTYSHATDNIAGLLASTNTPNTYPDGLNPVANTLLYDFGITSHYKKVIFTTVTNHPDYTNASGVLFDSAHLTSEKISLLGYIQESMPCFPTGTRIATSEGYKTVETLTIEDRVRTSDGRFVTPKIFKCAVPRATTQTAPYKVLAGALGNNYPPYDLTVSPLHAILDPTGVWHIPEVLAKYNKGVIQYDVGKPVTYYHIECPDFYTDNLMAEGCVVESFRNKQAGPEIVYEWNNELHGFVRLAKEESIDRSNRQDNLFVVA
jgi:hypothetical protein